MPAPRVYLAALCLCFCLATPAAATPADPAAADPAAADPAAADPVGADPAPVDTDADGLSDALERRTGTDPFDADTDGDGVADGVEDRNQDGVVDPGESDPRRHGLFPGSPPYIPEPLHFDLVRGLGAHKGELEANVLAVAPLRRGRGGVAWAPEIEWAFADGYAIEFELPMLDFEVEALKLALQGTFGDPFPNFIHGWQVIGEYLLHERDTELTALYLSGVRPARSTSLFVMAGARTTTSRVTSMPTLLINPSVYVDVNELLTVGVETNLAFDRSMWGALILPQVHWQVVRHVRLQLGFGLELSPEGRTPVAAARLVFE
jgi:hypothetical protein